MHSQAAWLNLTILVVEDSTPIRTMVCSMLTQSGYRCLEAGDGAEALRVLDANPNVDLVVTDLVMPKMDGAELARQLSRVRPELRMLFMSGYSEDSRIESFGQAPIFLRKPFTATALTEKVGQALASPGLGMPGRSSSITSR